MENREPAFIDFNILSQSKYRLLVSWLFRIARYLYCIIFFLFILSFDIARAQNDNWTHFRGNVLDGIASTESIPLTWELSNIKWRVKIHGRGYSSPVIYDNQIWVTTSTENGKGLYAVCIDFKSGKIIYDILVFSPNEVFGKHAINTYASPSPCIEKGFVYVNYGSLGTACISTVDGSIVWTRTDIHCNHLLGAGSSPIIYRILLIMNYDGTDTGFIIAVDKFTGKTIWKSDRPDKVCNQITEIGRKSYTTPKIVRTNGVDLLISVGSAVFSAYNPLTGAEVWRVVRGEESAASSPFNENGIIYYYTGFIVNSEKNVFTEMLAINPDGRGDITSTNVIWRKKDDQTLTQILSPVIKDGLIYTVNTKNLMMCIDAKTGREVWSVHQNASFNASPVCANGIVWFCSVKGDVFALREGRK
jgi:outer membrane protein assembly factor BamB